MEGGSNGHVTKPVNLFSLCANFQERVMVEKGSAGEGGGLLSSVMDKVPEIDYLSYSTTMFKR
jgi:hypothetical protein